jgi:hypothetical protein
MKLEDLPDGTRVFVDANILITAQSVPTRRYSLKVAAGYHLCIAKV